MQHLGDQITIKSYDSFFRDLKALAPKLNSENKKLLINSKTSLAVEVALEKVRCMLSFHFGAVIIAVADMAIWFRLMSLWDALW